MGHYGSNVFYLSRPFPQLDVFMHSGRPLAHFWHPWASKWLTVGSRWLPFSSLLAPCGCLLAPFGSLWLTFAILFEEILRTFINFILFREFARLINIFYEFPCFSRHHCLKTCIFANILDFYFVLATPFARSRRMPKAPQQKIHPLL